jgi:hypothetical protein
MSIKNAPLIAKEEQAERLMRGADGMLYRITPGQVIFTHEEDVVARQEGLQARPLAIQRGTSRPIVAAITKKVSALEE